MGTDAGAVLCIERKRFYVNKCQVFGQIVQWCTENRFVILYKNNNNNDIGVKTLVL